MVADPYSIVLNSVHKIQALKEAIERWRKFIGKRIRITIIENMLQDISICFILKKVTEGTIDSIFELPPGIMLKEVTERWVQETVWPEYKFPKSEETSLGEIKKSSKRFIPFRELGTFDFID